MTSTDPQSASRFNVLLTQDRQHSAGHWTRQLPRLLEPQGVNAYLARSGREAVDMVNDLDIHAALIDLATPQNAPPRTTSPGAPGAPGYPDSPDSFNPASSRQKSGGGGGAGGEAQGLWVLEVIRRLPTRPPVVVINSRAIAPKQAQRFLNDALRLGAFSVINRPSDIEDMLAVIRRLIDRQYEGAWPSN